MTKTKAEKLIYPWKVWTYNAPDSDGVTPVEIDYELAQNRKVGDILCAWASAPGTGKIVEEVTRIDNEGYGA